MRGLVEDRLAASLRLGADDGDAHERSIFASQAREAVAELRRLRLALRAIAGMRVDETTDHAQLSALCIATAMVTVQE